VAELRTEVAVVGGGIAGLAAAWALAKRGLPFLLLEASERWGGVIRTDRVDGFVLEAGPDAILAQKPEGLALCRELGLGDRLVPTNPERRTVYVLHGGRLHPLPEGMVLAIPTRILPFVRSGLFSWAGKLRMGLDLAIPARRNGGDESIASFLRRRFGDEAVSRLGEPLLAGIHAGDPERLSIQATFPRFAELERRHGSLIRGMLRAPRPSGPPPAVFYSLADGLGELVEALVARLPAASLMARQGVIRLAREGTGFVLTLADGRRVAARSVVLAVPGPKAAPLIEPLLPGVAGVVGAIPFASSATVLLGYAREGVAHPMDGYGMVVPQTEGLRCSALSFASTKFPGRAPEGAVLLRAFLGGVRDPEVLALDDAALARVVQDEMAPLLGLRGEPGLRRVYRWPNGTPQMEVGHLARMAQAEAQVASLPGLFLAGAGYQGTGIPDCVADGTRSAEAAAAHVAR
jgi:oxygen-dependent protoporphyrinogen oxidase